MPHPKIYREYTNYNLHKFDEILLKVNNAGMRLIEKGYTREDICLFMSKDIKDLLLRIFNNYVENHSTKNPQRSFMGYEVYYIKGKDNIYIGIKI